MTGMFDPPPLPLDEQGALADDFDCKKCAYNLRGLCEDGRCPECGTPVGLSTQGDLLRFADPDWLDKVERGLRIILWMILLGILAGVVSAIFSASIKSVVREFVSFLAALGGFYGVWLMTMPDPSRIG